MVLIIMIIMAQNNDSRDANHLLASKGKKSDGMN